jgi:hypothetical protein
MNIGRLLCDLGMHEWQDHGRFEMTTLVPGGMQMFVHQRICARCRLAQNRWEQDPPPYLVEGRVLVIRDWR